MTGPDVCRLLIHGPAPGPWNMAVDDFLLEQAQTRQGCCLRFYQWSQPTLSLGYFQNYAERTGHRDSAGCPVVRRSTGGGAILHDRELTYSFTVGSHHRLAGDALTLYRLLHDSLRQALASRGLEAAISQEQGGDEPFMCFQRRGGADLVLAGYKICGSAQRRRRGAILQHGSVLLGRSAHAADLPGLAEVAQIVLTPNELVASWLPELAATLAVDWLREPFSQQEEASIAEIVLAKHGNRAWIERR
jgi:lipoate-protein ligase A